MKLWGRVRTIIKNEYFYAIFIKILVILIGLLRTAFWARYLGANLKGNVEYIKSITSITCVLFTFGIHQAYPYFRKKIGKDKLLCPFYKISTKQFLLYTVASIFLFSILNNYFQDISYALLLTPVLVYARILQYIYLIEQPNQYNTNVLLVNIIDLVYSFVLLFFFDRYYVLGITSIVSLELLQIIFSTLFLNKEKKSTSVSTKAIKVKELISYGVFPMIALLLTTLNYRIDVIMLRQFNNISASDIGIYSVGIALVEKIVLIPDTLKGVLVSRLTKGKGPEEVAKLTRVSFALSVFITIMALLLGKPFISIFYGSEYIEAYNVIVVSAAGVLFVMFFKLIAQYNIVNNKQKRNVIMLSIAILINVIVNLILIPIYGILGAAIATGVGHAVSGIVFLISFHLETKIKYKDMLIINSSDIKRMKNR